MIEQALNPERDYCSKPSGSDKGWWWETAYRLARYVEMHHGRIHRCRYPNIRSNPCNVEHIHLDTVTAMQCRSCKYRHRYRCILMHFPYTYVYTCTHRLCMYGAARKQHGLHENFYTMILRCLLSLSVIDVNHGVHLPWCCLSLLRVCMGVVVPKR